MLKTIVIAAATLLLGIFIGGLGPRAELQRTRVALSEAESKAKRGNSALPLALGLGSLAAARDRANDKAAAATDQPESVPRVPRFTEETPAPETPQPETAEAQRDRPFLFGDGETLQAAKAAADLRAAQFRQAFLDQAKLAPQAVAAVDASIASLNAELETAVSEVARDLAARKASQETMSPRDFADVGARMLDVYRRNDDRLKAALDEEGRKAMRKTEFDLLTQIDISKLQPLAEVLTGMDPGGKP